MTGCCLRLPMRSSAAIAGIARCKKPSTAFGPAPISMNVWRWTCSARPAPVPAVKRCGRSIRPGPPHVSRFPGKGATVSRKSIKILPADGRLKADVVVAARYVYYENLTVRAAGVAFWTQPDRQQIVNYPKVHYTNGANKNSDARTEGWYKPTARMYKNARQRLVGENGGRASAGQQGCLMKAEKALKSVGSAFVRLCELSFSFQPTALGSGYDNNSTIVHRWSVTPTA